MARFEDYYDEHNNRSSGVAKAGLTTGIIGSSLAGLLGLGALGYNANGNNHSHCNEEILVNRYEAQQEHTIMTLHTENAMLKEGKETDRKLLELFKYFNGKVESMEAIVAKQAVQNQKTADSFTILRGALESETQARCCADNSIVNYVNSTFYPVTIEGITADPAKSYSMKTYNPLPGECCDTGCHC